MPDEKSIWTRELLIRLPLVVRDGLILALLAAIAAMLWLTFPADRGVWFSLHFVIATFFSITVAAQAIVFAVTFMLDQRRRRYQRRSNAGRCGHCGHDLTGSSLHCPECGAWHGRRSRIYNAQTRKESAP